MTYRQPNYSPDAYDPEPRPRPDWAAETPLETAKREGAEKSLRAFKRGLLIAAIAFGALGFWAGRASAETMFYALHIRFRPVAGGEWMTLYAGLLMTPELCAMAGNGVARELSAEVPDTYVTFTCIPVAAEAAA